MDCSKVSISKTKNPTKSITPYPWKNHNQVKNKEPLARCKSMNTTPTWLGSDTALSQTKGRKADVSNKVSTRLPLCKYILHLVVHTWEQPFFKAVGTSQPAQFRPISNCYAKHWWTKLWPSTAIQRFTCKPPIDEITIISPSNNEAASLDFSALGGCFLQRYNILWNSNRLKR